jgi:hypothetical protein
MPIKNGHGRRHVTELKMGYLPIFNLHGSKFQPHESQEEVRLGDYLHLK